MYYYTMRFVLQSASGCHITDAGHKRGGVQLAGQIPYFPIFVSNLWTLAAMMVDRHETVHPMTSAARIVKGKLSYAGAAVLRG
jgi:hypothetical protein